MTDKIYNMISLMILATSVVYLLFIVIPEAREQKQIYEAKCNDTGGEVIFLQHDGKRCIRPDTFIEIE